MEAAASRIAPLLVCAFLLAFAAGSDAKDFVVGGANGGGWKVPPQPDALNKWAEVNRFHVGDSLVFKFNGAADSVLEVTADDYNRCSTASPVAAYKSGDARVPLPRSGPHFFVSGAPGSCEKGERVIVLVMSERHGRVVAPVPAPTPPPAPAPLAAAGLVQTPAPAPATGAAAGRTVAGAGALALGAAVLGAAVLVAGF